MKEIPFSLAISGVIRIDEESIAITVNRTETVVRVELETKGRGRVSFGEGRNMFDAVLEAAVAIVHESGANRFTAAKLYHKALERYPELRRNSFAGHVIASAPDHPSHHHFSVRKDYFSYRKNGWYCLNDRYIQEETGSHDPILHSG
jgi:hypothetical protein